MVFSLGHHRMIAHRLCQSKTPVFFGQHLFLNSLTVTESIIQIYIQTKLCLLTCLLVNPGASMIIA